MIGRSRRRNWYVLATLLILVGGLSGCGLFGRQSGAPPTATLAPPPPTETPIPQIPTPTPSPMAAEPTFTPTTAAAVVRPQPGQPTLTPTTEAPARPEVGGGELSTPQPAQPAQQVSYVVKTIPVEGEAIVNGDFEGGFEENGIAKGWAGFDNGGVAKYTWMQDLRPEHASHGSSTQAMEISGAGQVDRYIGVYQTVEVIAGETYTLSLHGLLRSSTAEDEKVPYGHRMQYGIDYNGGSNWSQVQEWIDPGWNEVSLGEDNPTVNVYSLPITAKTNKLTLYIRGWAKWPIQSLARFYIDGVSLKGPLPGEETVVRVASSGGDGAMPTTGSAAIWVPIVGGVLLIGIAVWEMRKVWMRTS